MNRQLYLGLLLMLFTSIASAGFPTWIGVCGGLSAHDDTANPGLFQILINDSQTGVEVELAYRVNGGSWTKVNMNYSGTFSCSTSNHRWTYTPSSAFAGGATVEYYFRAYQNSSNLYYSNGGANYSFTTPALISNPPDWYIVQSGATNEGRMEWIGNNTYEVVTYVRSPDEIKFPNTLGQWNNAYQWSDAQNNYSCYNLDSVPTIFYSNGVSPIRPEKLCSFAAGTYRIQLTISTVTPVSGTTTATVRFYDENMYLEHDGVYDLMQGLSRNVWQVESTITSSFRFQRKSDGLGSKYGNGSPSSATDYSVAYDGALIPLSGLSLSAGKYLITLYLDESRYEIVNITPPSLVVGSTSYPMSLKSNTTTEYYLRNITLDSAQDVYFTQGSVSYGDDDASANTLNHYDGELESSTSSKFSLPAGRYYAYFNTTDSSYVLTPQIGFNFNSAGRFEPTFLCTDNSVNSGDNIQATIQSTVGLSDADAETLYKSCFQENGSNTNSTKTSLAGIPNVLESLADSDGVISSTYLPTGSSSDLSETSRFVTTSTINDKSISTLKSDLLAQLPENDRTNIKKTNFSYTDADNNLHITRNNTYLNVTFVAETASNLVSLGYFQYYEDENGNAVNENGAIINDPALVREVIFFPNTSYTNASDNGSAKGLVSGQTVVLGPFNLHPTAPQQYKTRVGFFQFAGGYNRTYGVSAPYMGSNDYSGWMYRATVHSFIRTLFTNYGPFYQLPESWAFYSLRALNNDPVSSAGVNYNAHSLAVHEYQLSSSFVGSGTIYDVSHHVLIGLEDLPNAHTYGDRDMNDIILAIEYKGGECAPNLTSDSDDCATWTCSSLDTTASTTDVLNVPSKGDVAIADLTLTDMEEVYGNGVSFDDWDGDGVFNIDESDGEMCVPNSPPPSDEMCYDDSLVDFTGSMAAITRKTFYQINGSDANIIASGQVAFNKNYFDVNTEMYTSSFDRQDWSGTVVAYKFDSPNWTIKSSAEWDATDKLDNMMPDSSSTSSRHVYFNNAGTLAELTTANLSDAQKQALLGVYTTPTVDDVDAAVDAQRYNKVGAVVNSNLVVMREPSAFYAFDDYTAFKTAQADRIHTVFTASNNGKLHAFATKNATTLGAELFSFLPTPAFNQIHKLVAQPDELHFLNDGKLTLGDAYNGTDWKTVLVGNLGAGGKGVYALDVTDPESPALLWEHTNSTIGGLSYMMTSPVITKLKIGLSDKWVAVFGNGYRGGAANQNGLVIVDLFTGDYAYVKLGSVSNGGVSQPTVVDLSGDGVGDLIYVGDLDGKLWRLDLDDITLSLAADGMLIDQTGLTPLFVTDDNRPISVAPLVLRKNNTVTQVIFGTGQYFEQEDMVSTDAEYLYSLVDSTTSSISTISSSDLQSNTVSYQSASGNASFSAFRTIAQKTPAAGDIASGWKLSLQYNGVAQGERLIATPTFLVGSIDMQGNAGVLMNTLYVDTTNCDYMGWVYALNPFTGMSLAGADFYADGVDNNDFIDIDDSAAENLQLVSGGQVSGRNTGSSNMSAGGNDSNRIGVIGNDGTFSQTELGTKSNVFGRINWRKLEVEESN